MPRISKHLGGPKIYVKRDDCTGLGTGGNKTRKLEFLIGEAEAQGADTILSFGALQSNHVRQTAAAAARAGMACRLVLADVVKYREPAYETSGNLLLDQLLGADVQIANDDAEILAAVRRVTDEEAAADADFARVLRHQRAFRASYARWRQLAYPAQAPSEELRIESESRTGEPGER